MRVDRVGAGLVVAAGMLAVSPAFAQERSVPSAASRGPPRPRDLMTSDAASLELNAALFRAADAGCVPVARRLIEAGASLAARDRLGAIVQAHPARPAPSAP